MEKRRGRRDIEVTRRIRGGIKRGENNLANNQFPMYSPQLEHLEMFTELHKEEKREEGEVTRRRRGGIKRGEISLASNQFPMCSPQPGTPREVYRVT